MNHDESSLELTLACATCGGLKGGHGVRYGYRSMFYPPYWGRPVMYPRVRRYGVPTNFAGPYQMNPFLF